MAVLAGFCERERRADGVELRRKGQAFEARASSIVDGAKRVDVLRVEIVDEQKRRRWYSVQMKQRERVCVCVSVRVCEWEREEG